MVWLVEQLTFHNDVIYSFVVNSTQNYNFVWVVCNLKRNTENVLYKTLNEAFVIFDSHCLS